MSRIRDFACGEVGPRAAHCSKRPMHGTEHEDHYDGVPFTAQRDQWDGEHDCDDPRCIEPKPKPKPPVEPVICSCGHRLAIHQYPYRCRGAVSFPDEVVACSCFRLIEFETIAADRALLEKEPA